MIHPVDGSIQRLNNRSLVLILNPTFLFLFFLGGGGTGGTGVGLFELMSGSRKYLNKVFERFLSCGI